MKTRQSVALVSVSALAAGVAKGAIIYSGPLNLVQTLGADDTFVRQPLNMIGDSTPELTFGYEFGSAWGPDVQKPYVDVRTAPSTYIPLQSGMVEVLGKANTGLPVTPVGTTIDAAYATTYPLLTGERGYLYQEGGGPTVVGDWSGTAITEGYVGILLNPGDGTHYGWLHFIDDPTTAPKQLTLVDWAYESTPGLGITIVPEPSTVALAGLGLAAMLTMRKRRQSP